MSSSLGPHSLWHAFGGLVPGQCPAAGPCEKWLSRRTTRRRARDPRWHSSRRRGSCTRSSPALGRHTCSRYHTTIYHTHTDDHTIVYHSIVYQIKSTQNSTNTIVYHTILSAEARNSEPEPVPRNQQKRKRDNQHHSSYIHMGAYQNYSPLLGPPKY